MAIASAATEATDKKWIAQMENEAIERLYKEIVKRLLVELEKVADARARDDIKSDEKGEWDFVDSLAVGSFLEQCSIAARHWELAGIATTLKQAIREMYKMDHSYLQDQEPEESEWVPEYSLGDLFGMDPYWSWRLLQKLGYVERKAGSGRSVPTDKASGL